MKEPTVDSNFNAAEVLVGVSPPGKPETLNPNNNGSKNKLNVPPNEEDDLNCTTPSDVPAGVELPDVIGTQDMTPAEVDCNTEDPVAGLVAGNV